MASVIDSGKALVARGKDEFESARQRWGWLDHILRTLERYNDRRGNLYAASITFTGILSIVPIIMVAFSVGGFVLAAHPEWLDSIKDEIVKAMPGELGTTVESAIDSAIQSRATVGIIGLVGAALTGIGWISGVRIGMTEMYGGRVERNAVKSKLSDLVIFVLLGIAFLVTLGLTALGNSGLINKILEWTHVDGFTGSTVFVRILAIAVSLAATWLLFVFVFARLPLNRLPFRNVLKAALLTAVIFEVLKSVAGIYLKSVLSSPAGAAFGPLLGIMVFGYLASRIVLYATAWCATDTANEAFQVVDPTEQPEPPTVVVRPVYEVNPVPKPGALGAAAAVGAAMALVARHKKSD
ncbi:YhjD/YihY/BrkB family envelope integrity protein [Gordonia otitidis]|uniref:Ribonuclease n=1 Tax=Gordonia otitidis (strain DSM 44809 / CCUG 52243 / JCM 12355 / NBRC 100426 / IFM 10032) TaxID=1108044 RepID=H5TLW6_GORO1|nr:YhjD/YihY/BrkB family envelope integrity protein [Gordonia otitidis]UEA59668.1 YihY/virulence factor BrkB family protein [Gordonia otitidis]GAB34474.1 putative ribonuclease [Gordonia otitidis NBRC 100426]